MNHYDLCLKEVFENKERFADLFSHAYFKGSQIVDPTKLVAYDKESHHDLGFRRERDLVMLYDQKFFLHLEFQMKKDHYMPVRILNYKYAGLHEQTKASTHFHRLYPVLSLTLYMGQTKWNTHKRLYECLDASVLEQTEIPDYEMVLFDIHSSSICFMDIYLQKFFRLIQYVYQENWDQLVQDKYLQEIEEDILQKANVFIELNEQFIEQHRQGGKINMCKAIENLKNQCRSDGFRKGFNNGFNNGFNDGINDGIHKEKESIALKMLQEGFALDTICRLTELSLPHLKKLQIH